eukprot:6213964-Pleurochrysis_carterae.AAC.2
MRARTGVGDEDHGMRACLAMCIGRLVQLRRRARLGSCGSTKPSTSEPAKIDNYPFGYVQIQFSGYS